MRAEEERIAKDAVAVAYVGTSFKFEMDNSIILILDFSHV